MRIVDRLLLYLKEKNLSHHAFEKSCGIANGYLKKQLKGKGTIGSEILDKILAAHPQLSLNWLITGTGAMLKTDTQELHEDPEPYGPPSEIIRQLQARINSLEHALEDKEKIIKMLEDKLQNG